MIFLVKFLSNNFFLSMQNFLPKSLQKLIEEFSKLPGIGPKSAQRLAMFLLTSPNSKLKDLGESILKLKEGSVFCDTCFNIAESSPCLLCSDQSRDHSIICVVENVLDTVALERTGDFNGLFHVLHGVLSPVEGVSPEQLKISELVERASNDFVKEIILATNPSLEGEATAMFIQKKLADLPVKITRIARGLPVGGDIEYADEITISRALRGRSEL